MKVLREYIYHKERAEREGQSGHHYVQNYEKTDFFCPNCGKQEVWVEAGPGDYYLGSDYLCTSCNHSANLDNVSESGPVDLEVIRQIKNGKADTPTTPRGH